MFGKTEKRAKDNEDNNYTQIKSQSNGEIYSINLDSEEVCPSCTCPDWIRYHIPCKHMFAVFQNIDGYSWENLPASYLRSPHISCDTAAICSTAEQNQYSFSPSPDVHVPSIMEKEVDVPSQMKKEVLKEITTVCLLRIHDICSNCII